MADYYGKTYEEYLLKRKLSLTKEVSWNSTAISMAVLDKMIIENLSCHRNSINYDQKSKVLKYDSTKLKVFTVACPVGVTVEDSSGTKVAYLDDDMKNIKEGYEAYFQVVNVGDEKVKIAIIPEEYNVLITGLDQGLMDVYIGCIENNTVSKSQSFNDIEIKNGSKISFDESSSDSDLFDMKVDGNLYQDNKVVTDYKITLDEDKYYCVKGGSLHITGKVETPVVYEKGSHKLTLYIAYLKNWSWVQMKAYYLDGGTINFDLILTLDSSIAKNSVMMTISVFDSNNFTTGASLYDNIFKVNMLDEKYSLTFDTNGSDEALTDRYITYGNTYGELPEPTKKGYIFGGWYTEANGEGDKIEETSTVTVITNQILYAYWIPKSYMITLNSGNADCDRLKFKVTYGKTYNTLENVIVKSIDGSKFLGWFTEESEGIQIKPSSKVEISQNTTLYAHFVPQQTNQQQTETQREITQESQNDKQTDTESTVNQTQGESIKDTTKEAQIETKKENQKETTKETTSNVSSSTKSAEVTSKSILTAKTDKDPSGSQFATIQAKLSKASKSSIKISWTAVKGAAKYIVFGNKCGKAYKELAQVKAKSYTQKKLTKGTYYKYLVVAVDSNNQTLSVSKTIHTCTLGGKTTDVAKVTTAAKKNKVSIKKGKTFSLKAKVVKKAKKLKLKNHRALAYESSNTKIATVSKKGVIKGVGKGTCYVYAYAQNGVYAKIKVTVK